MSLEQLKILNNIIKLGVPEDDPGGIDSNHILLHPFLHPASHVLIRLNHLKSPRFGISGSDSPIHPELVEEQVRTFVGQSDKNERFDVLLPALRYLPTATALDILQLARGRSASIKAEERIMYFEDEVMQRGDYLRERSSEELFVLMNDKNLWYTSTAAFSELVNRSDPRATGLIGMDAVQLLTWELPSSVLREILTRQLVEGKVLLWGTSLMVDNQEVLGQAVFAIEDAAMRSFDSINEHFIKSLFSLEGDEFFRAVGALIDNNLPVAEDLIEVGRERIESLLSKPQQIRSEYINVQSIVNYISTADKDTAKDWWEKRVPELINLMNRSPLDDKLYEFASSFIVGLAPHVSENLDLLSGLTSDNDQVWQYLNWMKTDMFWELIGYAPEKAQLIIDKYFNVLIPQLNVYFSQVIFFLHANYTENEISKLLEIDAVNNFINLGIEKGLFNITKNSTPVLREFMGSIGAETIFDELNEKLSDIEFNADEIYFLWYFVPDILDSNIPTKRVNDLLKEYRQLKQFYERAKANLDPENILPGGEEELFWMRNQYFLAYTLDKETNRLNDMLVEIRERGLKGLRQYLLYISPDRSLLEYLR